MCNSCYATGVFLDPLKILEIQRFFVFRAYRKRPAAWNGYTFKKHARNLGFRSSHLRENTYIWVFFNKVIATQPTTLFKMRLGHRPFLCKFCGNILNSFLTNNLWASASSFKRFVCYMYSKLTVEVPERRHLCRYYSGIFIRLATLITISVSSYVYFAILRCIHLQLNWSKSLISQQYDENHECHN